MVEEAFGELAHDDPDLPRHFEAMENREAEGATSRYVEWIHV